MEVGMAFDKVAELVAEQLGIDKKNITMDSNIIEDLGADSLDVIEMLMTLEDEYGITIPDEKINQIKTVGQIVELTAGYNSVIIIGWFHPMVVWKKSLFSDKTANFLYIFICKPSLKDNGHKYMGPGIPHQ